MSMRSSPAGAGFGFSAAGGGAVVSSTGFSFFFSTRGNSGVDRSQGRPGLEAAPLQVVGARLALADAEHPEDPSRRPGA